MQGNHGHCRQDIPLGAYDRKQQRWTLKVHHKEIEYLMQMIRRGNDASLAILDKIRAAPWKTRPPNMRQIIRKCGERDNTWEDFLPGGQPIRDGGRQPPHGQPSGRPTLSLTDPVSKEPKRPYRLARSYRFHPGRAYENKSSPKLGRSPPQGYH
jgi:hypothetical protein